jgi:hypothetical protein
MKNSKPKPTRRPPGGKAVDDENPNDSPMDGMSMPTGPAQPLDIERVESDRAKSTGPRPSETDKKGDATPPPH